MELLEKTIDNTAKNSNNSASFLTPSKSSILSKK